MINSILISLSLTALFLTGCQKPKVNDTRARLDALFSERYADADSAPGGAVIIARGDSIIYERYFGFADMDSRSPITDSTLFNIASVSKQFTVAALLQQDIDLDTPSAEFFDFPQDFWRDVTLAHLASHTSGIPDSRDRSVRENCIFATDETSVAYFPTVDTLKFLPGTAYDYLNPSFLLLAKVVEQKSGQHFIDYQQEKIFSPLGMSSTLYFSPDSMPANTAHGYAHNDDGTWSEYDYGEETFFATRPDGGIYSTARDMLAWERGLAKGDVLPDVKLADAYTPRISVSDSQWCDYQSRPNTYYGLGWFIEEMPNGTTKVFHTGDNGGFQAYVAKYIGKGLSIIVLENRHDKDRWQMAAAIDSILCK